MAGSGMGAKANAPALHAPARMQGCAIRVKSVHSRSRNLDSLPMPTVDLNADLGEGAPHEAALLGCVSSASIACGAHAGDAVMMRATLALARGAGVSVGAHPGF